MKRPKLSVALATFNEGENIGSCLQSIRDWADEIVIVDGGSSDKTVSIAKKYGAKIMVTDNPPIFHINKQKALEKCQGEWILQLDADERVSPELAEEIKKIISFKEEKIKDYQETLSQRKLFIKHQKLLEKRDGKIGEKAGDYAGFFVPRLNYFLGKYLRHGGVYPDGVIRLVEKGKAYFPCRSVHEQIVVQGKVGWLQNPLYHWADPTFKRYLARNNRYIDLLATDLKNKKVGKNPFQSLNYFLAKPAHWFFWTLIRHKGILDGWQGMVFSFFSALRFPRAYWRYLKNIIFLIFFLSIFAPKIWATSDYILPYPSFMPGHKLYFLEQIVDCLSYYWAFGNFARFKYELNLADKKVIEAKTLFEYRQYLLATKALSKSNQHFQKASLYLIKAEAEGKDISQKLANYQLAGNKHREVLKGLKEELPEDFLWQPENQETTRLDLERQIEEAIEIRAI